ncbi:MAG: peptide ABC transporter substrate-binding protein [Planctomycetes bacterium]|nr:peptide ABC transporter substrate-binding protein [Planctomycetota bacterium]
MAGRAGALPAGQVGLAAPRPDTLVVRLRAPCACFLALTAHFSCAPVRQDVIAAHGDAWTDPDKIVGNGPYRLALRRVRDRVRLVRNEQHARAAATRLQVIDALAIDSKATALNLYLTGDADWVNAIPAAALPRLRGRPDFFLNTVLATNFLRFNVTAPPLDDARVRRAIDLAIDRAALCRFVYRSGEEPARSLVPPSLPGYTPAAGGAGGCDAARALLAEAGYPEGRGFPELELLHAADESVRAVAEALAATLQQALGVRLRPAPQEFKVYLDSQKQLRYQVCLGMWIGDYPDPATFLDLFASDAGANRTGWKSARYDDLLRQAAAERDAARRAGLLREAEELLLREGPIAPICYRGQANLVSPRVLGFTTNLLDLHPLELLALR